MAFLHESLSEEKGGLCPPSITSELDRFKSRKTQSLFDHRRFNIAESTGQSVKHLQHLMARLSSAKHTDCGFFGHDEKEKVCG